MKHAIRPPVHILLRRFVIGAVPEALEIMPTNDRIAPAQDPPEAICRISVMTEGDTQIYSVFLPQGFLIRPADWRRFAYDHARVTELLSLCVRDNLQGLDFVTFGVWPWPDEQREYAETTLMVALADLSSIFDAKSVRFERHEEDSILTTIDGEHKNGEHGSYCFPFQPFATVEEDHE
jgi:hypothetical protein